MCSRDIGITSSEFFKSNPFKPRLSGTCIILRVMVGRGQEGTPFVILLKAIIMYGPYIAHTKGNIQG